MRLDHPPDEQAVLRYELGIDQLALKAGVALLDGRGPDHHAGHGREPALLELVDPVTRAVADADNLLDQIEGGHVVDSVRSESNEAHQAGFLCLGCILLDLLLKRVVPPRGPIAGFHEGSRIAQLRPIGRAGLSRLRGPAKAARLGASHPSRLPARAARGLGRRPRGAVPSGHPGTPAGPATQRSGARTWLIARPPRAIPGGVVIAAGRPPDRRVDFGSDGSTTR